MISIGCAREKKRTQVSLGRSQSKSILQPQLHLGEPWETVWLCPQDESSGGEDEDGHPSGCLPGTLCMGFRVESCINRSRGVGGHHQPTFWNSPFQRGVPFH